MSTVPAYRGTYTLQQSQQGQSALSNKIYCIISVQRITYTIVLAQAAPPKSANSTGRHGVAYHVLSTTSIEAVLVYVGPVGMPNNLPSMARVISVVSLL